MGSSRLPGKILRPLGGTPVLKHVITRVMAAGVFDEVVVATTDRALDDDAAALAAECAASVVRGDEADVLGRFALAAQQSHADAIMRITADCPLIDPVILAAIVERAGASGADMVTNSRMRTFPRGLDAEFFTRSALDAAVSEAIQPSEREHVTPFIYAHPERFVVEDFLHHRDYSKYRLTLDTEEDYQLLSRVFDASEDPGALRLARIIALMQANPAWSELNAHIAQKEL